MWEEDQHSNAVWGKDYIPGAIIGAVACFLLGVGALLYAFWLRGTEQVLASRGVHMQGTIVNRHIWDGRDADDRPNKSYYVVVRYLDSAPSKEFTVSRQEYDLARTASKVDVVYDPQNPTLARLEGPLAGNTSWEIIAIGSVLLAGGVAFTIWARKLKKDLREQAPDLVEALASARKSRRG